MKFGTMLLFGLLVAADGRASWLRRSRRVIRRSRRGRRPVNLVEFSYVENGATKRGAAVVFLFHGRYCIYTPEKGTVPFLRGTGSVQQLSRITASLRRIFGSAVTEPQSVSW